MLAQKNAWTKTPIFRQDRENRNKLHNLSQEEKKNIKVINGDGSNLEISPVYDHINAVKPKGKDKKPKDIVIPKGTNKKNQ